MDARTGLGRAGGAVLLTWAGVSLLTVWSASGRTGTAQVAANDRLTIDDFEGSTGKDPSGLLWTIVTDRTTGKSPAATAEIEEHEQHTCLHLMGTIPAGGRGGSVEARRSLATAWAGRTTLRPGLLDARAYDGIRLVAKGNGQTYALHLRTRETRFPGQYYEARFETSEQWQEIRLPFGYFVASGPLRPLDLAGLASVALVASSKTLGGGQEADIYVDEVGFYREPNMNRNLTPEEERVIVYKGTERPFTGKYTEHFEKGVYVCRRCGAELFESQSKFRSECGWPSFDDQIPGAVHWQLDADGRRTEAVCANCGAHLGHIFQGEGFTPKNTRYCVNSVSMDFVPADQRTHKPESADPKATTGQASVVDSLKSQAVNPPSAIPNNVTASEARQPQSRGRALFASGCFWGTEYYMQRAPGVISTTVGYTGGHVDHPTYEQVCTGRTGHAETVEVIYDPTKTDYEQLAKLFFETHDFTQLNRQGPDIGQQYRSAIFYLNDEQKQTAERLAGQLRRMGYDVKTEITPAGKFWPAERYHQDYYNKTGGRPYCHIYRPIFASAHSETR
jgi:peptide methionine sulfoxide reductase msrA/msrB